MCLTSCSSDLFHGNLVATTRKAAKRQAFYLSKLKLELDNYSSGRSVQQAMSCIGMDEDGCGILI